MIRRNREFRRQRGKFRLLPEMAAGPRGNRPQERGRHGCVDTGFTQNRNQNLNQQRGGVQTGKRMRSLLRGNPAKQLLKLRPPRIRKTAEKENR